MNDTDDNKLHKLLDDNLDNQEYEAIVNLLDNEDCRKSLSQQMDIVLNRLETEDTSSIGRSERDLVLARIMRKIWRKRWFLRAGYAAALAAMFVCGWLCSRDPGNRTEPSEDFCEIAVAKGERPLHLAFQDGTHAVINAGSTLRYPREFGSGTRTVQLSGEAYFYVKADPARPFTVVMEQARINVTGTAFNARSYEADSLTVVTLDDGSLDFDCDGKSFTLKPSQKVIYNHNSQKGTICNSSSSASRSSLWKDNIIAFDKTPMSEVLNTINRIYDVEFLVRDANVLEHTFTFTSAYVPLDSLLQDIELISYVEFRHNGKQIEVYSHP
ncbi:MAG: FecR domain-containing protein [Muribaculaceae bacterium]|nr:FecR domain-containing protein [Muribaculaceae bacterium]